MLFFILNAMNFNLYVDAFARIGDSFALNIFFDNVRHLRKMAENNISSTSFKPFF